MRKLISAKDYWTRMDNDRETYVREEEREKGIKSSITLLARVGTPTEIILKELSKEYELPLHEAEEYVQKYSPETK